MNPYLISWDSVVFISWIMGKQGNQQHQQNIKVINPMIEAIIQDRCQLVISPMVYVEILESTMPEGTMGRFSDLIEMLEMAEVPMDTRVALKAQKIRDHVIRNGSSDIGAPDAILLATAIIGEARVFHTFDHELLKLSQTEKVDDLCITKCVMP